MHSDSHLQLRSVPPQLSGRRLLSEGYSLCQLFLSFLHKKNVLVYIQSLTWATEWDCEGFISSRSVRTASLKLRSMHASRHASNLQYIMLTTLCKPIVGQRRARLDAIGRVSAEPNRAVKVPEQRKRLGWKSFRHPRQ